MTMNLQVHRARPYMFFIETVKVSKLCGQIIIFHQPGLPY